MAGSKTDKELSRQEREDIDHLHEALASLEELRGKTPEELEARRELIRAMNLIPHKLNGGNQRGTHDERN